MCDSRIIYCYLLNYALCPIPESHPNDPFSQSVLKSCESWYFSKRWTTLNHVVMFQSESCVHVLRMTDRMCHCVRSTCMSSLSPHRGETEWQLCWWQNLDTIWNIYIYKYDDYFCYVPIIDDNWLNTYIFIWLRGLWMQHFMANFNRMMEKKLEAGIAFIPRVVPIWNMGHLLDYLSKLGRSQTTYCPFASLYLCMFNAMF